VVIDNFNVFRPIASLRPFEADALLLINSDTVLPSAVTGQGLQTVAAKLREIAQTSRGFQDTQPLLRLTTERFETGARSP
jgi:hypothetical protein